MYEIFDNEKDNLLILDAYHRLENIKIKKSDNVVNRCYLFFTSHGLYYPTTIENFSRKVLEEDKYEWVNISENSAIRRNASEFVFVRDVYKNWCIQGINGSCNSIKNLYERLKSLTEGKEVITVGSSAGGFMAILFGCLLRAKTIYAFSPQVSLHRYHVFHPIKYFDEYRRTPGISEYMELAPLMKVYQGNLYYFYPNACPEDMDQHDAVKGLKKVRFFSVNHTQHGVTFHGDSIVKILSMSTKRLDQLWVRYLGRKINPDQFLIRTSGLAKGLLVLSGKKLRKLIKKD